MRCAASPRALFVCLAAVLACSISTASAKAHGRSMSYSTWTADDAGAHVELRLKLIELTRERPGYAWEKALPAELTMEAGGEPCRANDATRAQSAPVGWAIFRWRIHCNSELGPRFARSTLLSASVANHAHFIRVKTAADRVSPMHERILVTGGDSVLVIDAPDDDSAEEPQTSLTSFIVLGATHISSGWDHLAFVFALLLLAGSLREVAVLVTSFTAAHSLTLALAVTGLVRPDAEAVEIVIAVSIALIAAENTWLLAGRDRIVPAAIVGALVAAACAAAATGGGALEPAAWLGLALFSGCHFGLLRRAARPRRLRASLAFAFGLLHGFGFAGALMELELPPATLAVSLFGFNVGVEAGQLVVVALAWPLLRALEHRSAGGGRLFAEIASAAIFAAGLFWIVDRAL